MKYVYPRKLIALCRIFRVGAGEARRGDGKSFFFSPELFFPLTSEQRSEEENTFAKVKSRLPEKRKRAHESSSRRQKARLFGQVQP